MLDALERTVNRLADRDILWWPFLRERPRRDEDYPGLLVIRQAFFAVITGNALAASSLLLLGREVPLAVLGTVMTVLLPVALLLQAGVAWCWNRRARRLRSASTSSSTNGNA